MKALTPFLAFLYRLTIFFLCLERFPILLFQVCEKFILDRQKLIISAPTEGNLTCETLFAGKFCCYRA